MKSKWMRNASIYLLVAWIIVTVFAIMIWVYDYTSPPGSFLRGVGMGVASILLFIFLPSLFTSICGIRYYKGKSKGRLTACWIWGGITAVVYGIIIIAFIIPGLSSVVDVVGMIIQVTIFSVLPIVLFLVGCYRELLLRNKQKIK